MYFHAILKKVKEKSKWSGTCWSQNSKHSFTCIQFFDTILLKFILSWNELKTSSNTIDKILILLGRISYLCLKMTPKKDWRGTSLKLHKYIELTLKYNQ
jgi:hypothetical protein